MRSSFFRYSIFVQTVLSMILLLAACSSRPDGVVSSGKMEELLYDMHKAHFLQESQNIDRFDGKTQYAIMQTVLDKHGISQTEWDSTLVYYTRNADELSDIYTKLYDRLSYEASIMGAGISEVSDSTDIWSGEKFIILTDNELSSTYQWQIDVDTLLQQGEKIKLRYMAIYLNDNSNRRATAVMSIRLKNDSVMTFHNVPTQNGIYNIDLEDHNRIGVKSISGLFMLHKPSINSEVSESNEQIKKQVLCISGLTLTHEAPPAPVQTSEDKVSQDSIQPPKQDRFNKVSPGNGEIIQPTL